MNTRDIYERIYAGFIAKAIGVRLGAPVKPTIWSYERIEKTYGEVTQYLQDFKNFAADDDTNGPVYFIRSLRDYNLDVTAEEVGKTLAQLCRRRTRHVLVGRLWPIDRAHRLPQSARRHSGAPLRLPRHRMARP